MVVGPRPDHLWNFLGKHPEMLAKPVGQKGVQRLRKGVRRRKEKLLGYVPWIGVWLVDGGLERGHVWHCPQEGTWHQAMKPEAVLGMGCWFVVGFPNLQRKDLDTPTQNPEIPAVRNKHRWARWV